MVTPLSTPPLPANSNPTRGMFTWVTTNSTQDPLNTTAKQQALINFCGATATKTNLIFLDMWNYVGANNWTTTKLNNIRQFIDAAAKSGISVYGLAGNADWAINQAWVQTNIIRNLKWFNDQAITPSKQFKGFIYDVEYWTDSNQTSQVSAPGLCDLMNNTRNELGIRVGLFAAFYLKDNDATWPTINYQGRAAQDGEFLVDNSDFVVPGTYRDHANDNGTDGPGQNTLFQPWYDYTKTQTNAYTKVKPLFVGSETTDVTPSYVTYFGQTKTAMEAEHTITSNNFFVAGNPVFNGHVVHSYDGWKAMAALQATGVKVDQVANPKTTVEKVKEASSFKFPAKFDTKKLLEIYKKKYNLPNATLESIGEGYKTSTLAHQNSSPKVADLLENFRKESNNPNAALKDMMQFDAKVSELLFYFQDRNGVNAPNMKGVGPYDDFGVPQMVERFQSQTSNPKATTYDMMQVEPEKLKSMLSDSFLTSIGKRIS